MRVHILNEFEHIHGKKKRRSVFQQVFQGCHTAMRRSGGTQRNVLAVVELLPLLNALLYWKWIGKFKACPIIESSWGNFWPCAAPLCAAPRLPPARWWRRRTAAALEFGNNCWVLHYDLPGATSFLSSLVVFFFFSIAHQTKKWICAKPVSQSNTPSF